MKVKAKKSTTTLVHIKTVFVARADLDVLATVLRRLRWDDQGGYPSYYGDDRWGFVSTGLPQTTPDELNALFRLAGVVPDEIVPLGSCDTCVFSREGRERGYEQPCGPCKRPLHSKWKPLYSERDVQLIDAGRVAASTRHGICPYTKKAAMHMTMTAPGSYWCSQCGATVSIKVVAGVRPLKLLKEAS